MPPPPDVTYVLLLDTYGSKGELISINANSGFQDTDIFILNQGN